MHEGRRTCSQRKRGGLVRSKLSVNARNQPDSSQSPPTNFGKQVCACLATAQNKKNVSLAYFCRSSCFLSIFIRGFILILYTELKFHICRLFLGNKDTADAMVVSAPLYPFPVGLCTCMDHAFEAVVGIWATFAKFQTVDRNIIRGVCATTKILFRKLLLPGIYFSLHRTGLVFREVFCGFDGGFG